MAGAILTVALPLLGAVAIWLSGHDWRSRSHCVMVMSICGTTALAAWIAVLVPGQRVLPRTLESTTSVTVCVGSALLPVVSLGLATRVYLDWR